MSLQARDLFYLKDSRARAILAAGDFVRVTVAAPRGLNRETYAMTMSIRLRPDDGVATAVMTIITFTRLR